MALAVSGAALSAPVVKASPLYDCEILEVIGEAVLFVEVEMDFENLKTGGTDWEDAYFVG